MTNNQLKTHPEFKATWPDSTSCALSHCPVQKSPELLDLQICLPGRRCPAPAKPKSVPQIGSATRQSYRFHGTWVWVKVVEAPSSNPGMWKKCFTGSVCSLGERTEEQQQKMWLDTKLILWYLANCLLFVVSCLLFWSRSLARTAKWSQNHLLSVKVMQSVQVSVLHGEG